MLISLCANELGLSIGKRWHGPALLQPGPPGANKKLSGPAHLC